jgi:hypothetical protein
MTTTSTAAPKEEAPLLTPGQREKVRLLWNLYGEARRRVKVKGGMLTTRNAIEQIRDEAAEYLKVASEELLAAETTTMMEEEEEEKKVS